MRAIPSFTASASDAPVAPRMSRTADRTADVIVVGAGIVGAFCARALRDAGLEPLIEPATAALV